MGDAWSHVEAARCLLTLLYLAVFLPLPVHPDDLDDEDDNEDQQAGGGE